jgi:hypothetical protein
MRMLLAILVLLHAAWALPPPPLVRNNSTASPPYHSTPSPFVVRPIPFPYPPIDRFHLHRPPPAADAERRTAAPPAASDALSASAERRLGAFFKLAHSRILTDGRASDIRTLAAGLLPVYLQLCQVLGGDDEGVDCDAAVWELFRARYNEVRIELDRLDRLHLVLVRLKRARGRWIGRGGRMKVRGAAASTVGRRVRKGDAWDHAAA